MSAYEFYLRYAIEAARYQAALENAAKSQDTPRSKIRSIIGEKRIQLITEDNPTLRVRLYGEIAGLEKALEVI